MRRRTQRDVAVMRVGGLSRVLVEQEQVCGGIEQLPACSEDIPVKELSIAFSSVRSTRRHAAGPWRCYRAAPGQRQRSTTSMTISEAPTSG